MGKNRQRWGRHASEQPAAASAIVVASVQPIAAERWPGRSGSIEGRQVSCGGDSLLCFLLKASTAPQARRREGFKPNGRDSNDGTGHSPKSTAARDRDHRCFVFFAKLSGRARNPRKPLR